MSQISKRLRHTVRAVGFVRKHRKDHHRDEHEEHDRPHIGIADGARKTMQRLLPVQKQRNHSSENHDQKVLSGNEKRPQRVEEEDCHLRGESASSARAETRKIGEEHRARWSEEEPRAENPAAVDLRELAADGAEQGDQRKCANASESRLHALPLQADEQAQPQRDEKLLRNVKVHIPRSVSLRLSRHHAIVYCAKDMQTISLSFRA